MATSGKSRGIFPSDIVLRDAIRRGIAFLRARPRLVEDVFATLADDDETSGRYGRAQAREALEWFQNNDIPVRIADAPQPPQGTSVIIQLAEGGEEEGTLGEVHYETSDPDDRVWPTLAGPFDPASYDVATGLLRLPDAVTLVPAQGMVLVDADGREFEVLGSPANKVVQITTGSRGNFRGAFLRGARPARAVSLRSLVDREAYQVGAHVYGEPAHLSYLYPIVKYVLLRAREELEARGMERVRYSYSATEKDSSLGAEALWSRYVDVTLFVRQTWVQDEHDKVYTVQGEVSVGLDVDLPDLDVDVLGG